MATHDRAGGSQSLLSSYNNVKPPATAGTAHHVLSLHSRKAQGVFAGGTFFVCMGLSVAPPVSEQSEELFHLSDDTVIYRILGTPALEILREHSEQRVGDQHRYYDRNNERIRKYVNYAKRKAEYPRRAAQTVKAVSLPHKVAEHLAEASVSSVIHSITDLSSLFYHYTMKNSIIFCKLTPSAAQKKRGS